MNTQIAITALGLALVLGGCSAATATRKLSDDANNIAMAERFGRMDIVTDAVAANHRDEFAAAHSAWGHSIRIVDLEYAGMRVMPGDIAHVELIVAWQRLDESTLRTTTLRQTWSHNERWEIMNEKRISGDTGLIDEPDDEIDVPAPKSDGKKYRQLSRTDNSLGHHARERSSEELPSIPSDDAPVGELSGSDVSH